MVAVINALTVTIMPTSIRQMIDVMLFIRSEMGKWKLIGGITKDIW